MARDIARGNRMPKSKQVDSPYHEIRHLNQAFHDSASMMLHNINQLEETRELLDHSEQRLRKLINGMHEVLFELDPDGQILFLNPTWQAMTGFTIDESLGRSLADFLVEDEISSLFGPESIGKLKEHNRQIRLRTAEDKILWANLEAEAQYDASGAVNSVIGTLNNITDTLEMNKLLKRYQKDLYHLSVTDPLTGLYNRRHFDSQLDVILNEHLPLNQPVCLILIDINGFKFINDTYGHPFGDEVLKTISKLLLKLARNNDYVARLAGDEFVMVLKSINLEKATRIAETLHANISGTYVNLPVGRLQLQTSIGVAEAPTHASNVQELISAADVALYHSKQRGRNRIEVLSPDINKAVMSIFSQGFELRHALERGNINPAFQPICNMQSGQPMAYEVLARMRHNDSIIHAKEFIVLAEELGLTHEVDLHIIKQALAHAPKDQALFLNVDLSSFNDKNFVQELGALIKPACEAGQKITLEITERETVPITETLLEDIRGLRALGCKLALDDFGSGYSTYNFLNLFRPDYIKIDGAFVRSMLDNEASHKIVVHIHELATSFGMETIAESVENIETLKALQKIGVRTAQGLHFGAPEMMN
jgi:diguanylate cyclase (GGDEF)-like protein/PAS domain S-box-containing protein